MAKARKPPKRKSITGVNISPDERVELYALSRALPSAFKEKSGLLLPFLTWFQDPFGAKTDRQGARRARCSWPGNRGSPTDPPARVSRWWTTTATPARSAAGRVERGHAGVCRHRRQDTGSKSQRRVPVPSGQRLGAAAMRAGLLRRRLGARAPHSLGVRGQPPDRRAARRLRRERLLRPGQQVAAVLLLRSDADAPVYTCLSVDIVHHEFGHAVLDGIRPLFNESITPADRRLPRVRGRFHRDSADAAEPGAAPATGHGIGGQVRRRPRRCHLWRRNSARR